MVLRLGESDCLYTKWQDVSFTDYFRLAFKAKAGVGFCINRAILAKEVFTEQLSSVVFLPLLVKLHYSELLLCQPCHNIHSHETKRKIVLRKQQTNRMSLAWTHVTFCKLVHYSPGYAIYYVDRDLCGIINIICHDCKHILVEILIQKFTVLTVVCRQEVFLLASR